jgi:putative redox protein
MAAPPGKKVSLEWRDALVFSGVGAGGVPITIDADNARAPGPMETLLLALAACTGSDVAIVMKKKRVAVESFVVEVEGDRRAEFPQRYVAIRLRFRFTARALTEAAARQAIELSLQKYCSVAHSLHPDIPITYELVIHT